MKVMLLILGTALLGGCASGSLGRAHWKDPAPYVDWNIGAEGVVMYKDPEQYKHDLMACISERDVNDQVAGAILTGLLAGPIAGGMMASDASDGTTWADAICMQNKGYPLVKPQSIAAARCEKNPSSCPTITSSNCAAIGLADGPTANECISTSAAREAGDTRRSAAALSSVELAKSNATTLSECQAVGGEWDRGAMLCL